MSILLAPLGVIGLVGVAYMLYILANLSQRLGAVRKMPPYYLGFYVALGFLLIAILARIARSSLVLAPQQGTGILADPLFNLAIYYGPFLIAMIISVAVAWTYWSWLLKEKLS